MNNVNGEQYIFNQMIESAVMEGLSISQDNVPREFGPYCFTCQVNLNNDTIQIYCWLDIDAEDRYANILVQVGTNHIGMSISELMEIADDVNGHFSLYHLATCPDCGSLELRSGLIVPGKDLPRNKFGWLLNSMIKEGKHIRKYMSEVDGIDADCQQPSCDEPSCADPFVVQSLEDISGVINKLGLPIGNDFRKDKNIYFDVSYDSYPNLFARVGIRIERKPDHILIVMTSPNDIIPEDRHSEILELICRINKTAYIDHVYIHPDTRRPIVQKGILMTAGILDSSEVEKSIKLILGNGSFYLRLIREQMTSREKPIDVFNRMYAEQFGMPAPECQ